MKIPESNLIYKAEMQAFDNLPTRLQKILNNCPFGYSSIKMLQDCYAFGDNIAILKFEEFNTKMRHKIQRDLWTLRM